MADSLDAMPRKDGALAMNSVFEIEKLRHCAGTLFGFILHCFAKRIIDVAAHRNNLRNCGERFPSAIPRKAPTNSARNGISTRYKGFRDLNSNNIYVILVCIAFAFYFGNSLRLTGK